MTDMKLLSQSPQLISGDRFANSKPEACEGSRSPLRHRLLPIADEVIE
jgi:hypothetical protein